jgi:RNA polymerase subunit RPABC4/transcription elongation factor Spt4
MDLLDRLHRRLLKSATGSQGPDTRRITIADLYQRLIPYRAVRGEVGVMELAEYEHALLRLLSGERRYVEVGDPTAILEIQRELASLNPILGIYRDYPNVEVRIAAEAGVAAVTDSPRKAESIAASPGQPVTDPERRPPSLAKMPTARAHSEPTGSGAASAAASAIRPPAAMPTHPPTSPTARAPYPASNPTPSEPAPTSSRACHGCKRHLPDRPDAVYCPFCGAAQGPVPCRSCGAALESSWRFCARCGANRSATPAL